tara:strand:- start:74 stop:1789 length:1716 start_codon:yes stop_codon:yes gene_type:complete
MGVSLAPAFDPRTGGGMPHVAGCYGAGGSSYFIIDEYGTLENRATNVAPNGITIMEGRLFAADTAARTLHSGDLNRETPIANSGGYLQNNGAAFAFVPDNDMDGKNGLIAIASDAGFSQVLYNTPVGVNTPTAVVTRDYTSGYMVQDIRGVWASGSSTTNARATDRSYKANITVAYGTATDVQVASGAELYGAGTFDGVSYLYRANDADYNALGTGEAYLSCWFKSSGTASTECLFGIGDASNAIQFYLSLLTSGYISPQVNGASATASLDGSVALDDGAWHKADLVRRADADHEIYIDGVLVGTDATTCGTISGTHQLAIGGLPDPDITTTTRAAPALTSTVALAKIAASAPSATQVRDMYIGEKGMFLANSKCLLQSATTDVVLDVDIDPITGKVAVTQTDAIMIFDGLVVDSTPTVNAGASEHYLLYGGDIVDLNSVNLYASVAVKDLRGDLEYLRGLQVPQGPDLSKVKAWLRYNASTNSIKGSLNVKSITDTAVGNFTVFFGVPFKSENYVAVGMMEATSAYDENIFYQSGGSDRTKTNINIFNDAAVGKDSQHTNVVWFGELENE